MIVRFLNDSEWVEIPDYEVTLDVTFDGCYFGWLDGVYVCVKSE